MKNSAIRKVVISGVAALICIMIVQGYWLKNTFDHSAKAFEEKVNICLRNVAVQLSELKQVQLPSLDLVNQIAQDYYVVNIREAIDANSLEFYLKKEFDAVGLHTDFEYGIYDCATDQMVYGNYISNKTSEQVIPYSSNLPTYNEFVYYFGVRFPDRQGYILKSQWIPILFTVLLVLAMLFFAYATYEIFRQKKLSDLQKDFINNMTHEFKTPLTSIKVSAGVFLKDPNITANPRLKQYAEIIDRQATRINDQVERVLQIADMDRDATRLKLEAVDFREVTQHVVTQLQSRLDARQGNITMEFKAVDHSVRADPLHLGNVIYNLVDNALKYSPEHPSIHIATRDKGNGVEWSIRDRGIGIDNRYLDKLHQKFFRVPTGDVHNAKGFGLGLHYVYQVMRSMGWKINVTSQVSKGTTVSLYAPKFQPT